MINALEGREQYQVCGQNCDPPDENNVDTLVFESQPLPAARAARAARRSPLTSLPIASLLSLIRSAIIPSCAGATLFEEAEGIGARIDRGSSVELQTASRLAALSSVLSTETRIKCFAQAALWKFRLYWSLVGPFSGFMRKAILKQVKTDGIKG
jgi:hypothetical protein